MAMPHKLSFRLQFDGGVLGVMPLIDGITLADMVGEYERSKEYTPSSGYGGVDLGFYEAGPLLEYLRGASEPVEDGRPGAVYLLGCAGCGEVGCWPLVATIRNNGDTYSWGDFKNPHRKTRDYSGFGPFSFSKAEYEAAVAELSRIGNRNPRGQ